MDSVKEGYVYSIMISNASDGQFQNNDKYLYRHFRKEIIPIVVMQVLNHC